MMGLITCREASERLSRRMEEPLGPRELLGLRMHLLACSHCRRFDAQVRVLRQAFSRLSRLESEEEP